MNDLSARMNSTATASVPGPRKKKNAEPSPPVSGEEPLYADRVRVYPRDVKGQFRRLKWLALVVLMAIYYVAPWLRWDRGPGAPDQAILIDMPGRRAYFFAIEIWPQEVYYLTGLLILAAVGLFFITALLGRVWCGFACWQTVWTDLYMWVERLIEGDRNRRIKLDKGPLTIGKAAKKVAKHAAWLLIALLTGGAFIWYFDNAPRLTVDLFTGTASPTQYTFVGLFTFTTYLLAGWAREQVCIYMCPWPRFQAAMFDEDSLIVTYEAWRGEPRGPARKGMDFSGRGHCVDCGMCVQVCPTGVDIRKGNQLACIGCALCVDACNTVMDRFGLPRGLITYDSVNNQNARAKAQPTAIRLVRPRTIVYVVLLSLVAGIMAFSLATRSRLEVNVLPDRAPLFVTLSDGRIRNAYTVKILNMERQAHTYALTARGLEGARLSGVGLAQDADRLELTVRPDAVGEYRVFVTVPPENLKGKGNDLVFAVADAASGRTAERATVFSGPGN
jgi:cytochrome c oxidase accessory protein FixG